LKNILLTINFAAHFTIMDQHTEKDYRDKDFTRNWVNSSVFLFYLQVFCILAFVVGGSYSLYKNRYKGKPEVEIQSSTLYTPQYQK
jgi:hypothetical protein